MTKLSSKQRRSVIIDLDKRCTAFYEKHPGAWKNAEQARWLIDAEVRLNEQLDTSRTMIDMRKAANEFYKRFVDVCRQGQEARSNHP